MEHMIRDVDEDILFKLKCWRQPVSAMMNPRSGAWRLSDTVLDHDAFGLLHPNAS
jgi:hypothetical protein